MDEKVGMGGEEGQVWKPALHMVVITKGGGFFRHP